MQTLLRQLARILVVLLLGGFAGATLVRVAPGFGADEEQLDPRLNGASQEALRSAGQQNTGIARFYADYCIRLAHGDFGRSVALNEPVRTLLAERIPETAKSVGVGLAFAWALGFGMALLSLLHFMRTVGWVGWVASSVILCIPAAVLAMTFVLIQAPARVAVGLIVFPKIFQFARNLLLRSASLPHILTARAKGVGELRVVFLHILPVSATQLLSLAGVSVCLALAACIPVEVVCDLPGIGQLAWKAALSRDLALLVNLTMLVTLVTLIANGGSALLSGAIRMRDV